MSEIERDSTDREQEPHDQEGKPSAKSADNMEKKPTDGEKAKDPEDESSAISADNIKKKPTANEILKKLEELVRHEPSIVSEEVIKELQNICSQLEEKLPKVEDKKPPSHQRLSLEEGKLDPILNNFKVSYDNLNAQSRICLLYLALFPEDAAIKKRPIIYWWIANGLVKPISTGEKKKTAEEVGEDVFQELLQSHLIMAREENEISTVNKFPIHPWIRHMLITLARKANLFDFNPQGVPGHRNASSGHVCLQEDGDSKTLMVSKKPEEHQHSLKEKTANSSHVGSQEDGNSKEPREPQQTSEGKTANSGHVGSQEDGYSQKLQSSEEKAAGSGRIYFKTLFNVGDKYLSLNPTSFADKLVALQLGRWQAQPDHHIEVERDDSLSKFLGNQKLLKYLSLRGISRITALPNSILELTNLEILDLKACHNLETLPDDISALRKLTHFDVSECYLLDGMPKGLGKLTSLEALKGFIIAESKRTPTRIGDLKSLQNLKRFSIRIGSEAEIVQGEFQGLEQLESVQRLKISWGVVSRTKKEQVIKEDFKLPTSLEKLTLEGLPHDKFPDWLKPSKLKKLKMLYIEGGSLGYLSHRESDHEWKVETLHLWYMNKSPEIDLPQARHWFPYLRCDPKINYRKEASQSKGS